jgi:hypothetical protein
MQIKAVLADNQGCFGDGVCRHKVHHTHMQQAITRFFTRPQPHHQPNLPHPRCTIEATAPQLIVSLGDDGSVLLTGNDDITVHTLNLRCDAGWCGVKFTQARSLATVSCSGELQLRSIPTLPPRAAEGDVEWPC